MNVILEDQVEFPSITSREYVEEENGVVVSTRLPANLFSFGVNEEPVTIRGSVELQFSSGRKLRVDNIFDAPEIEEEARFEVEVSLLREAAVMKSSNAAANVASITGHAIVGMFFLIACIV